MSITITIKMASLLSDIRIKSHMNTERVKDPEDRYAVRAGEENEAEQREALQETWRDVQDVCRKFLSATQDTAGSDALEATIATADKTLVLDVTSRRSSHIADSLASAVHEFLVAGTLRRFYTSAAMPDLVAIYTSNEAAARASIVSLLYTKQEPVYTP